MRNHVITIIGSFLLLSEVISKLPNDFEYICKDKNDFIHAKWRKEYRYFVEDPMNISVSQYFKTYLEFDGHNFKVTMQFCLIWMDILSYSTFVFKLKTNSECREYAIKFEFTQRNKKLTDLNRMVYNIPACNSDHYYSTDVTENIMSIPKYIGRSRRIFIPIGIENEHRIEAVDQKKLNQYQGITFSNGGIDLECLATNSGEKLDIYIKKKLSIFRLFHQEWKEIAIQYLTTITLPVNSDHFQEMDLQQILLIKDNNIISRIDSTIYEVVTNINFKYEKTSMDIPYYTHEKGNSKFLLLHINSSHFCGKIVNVTIKYYRSRWYGYDYLYLQFENKCKYSLIEFYKKNVALNMNHKNGKMSIQIVNNAPKTIILLLKFTTNHHTAYDVRIIHSTSSDVTLCLCTNMVEYNPVVCNITDSMHIFELEVFGSLNGKESSLIWTLEAKPSGTIPTIK